MSAYYNGALGNQLERLNNKGYNELAQKAILLINTIHTYLDRLTDEKQEIVRLYFTTDITVKEIAVQYRINERTVRQYTTPLSKTIKKLLTELEL